MSNDKVIELRGNRHFGLEAEIANRLKALLMEYEGQISLVTAMGILEIVKLEIKEAAE